MCIVFVFRINQITAFNKEFRISGQINGRIRRRISRKLKKALKKLVAFLKIMINLVRLLTTMVVLCLAICRTSGGLWEHHQSRDDKTKAEETKESIIKDSKIHSGVKKYEGRDIFPLSLDLEKIVTEHKRYPKGNAPVKNTAVKSFLPFSRTEGEVKSRDEFIDSDDHSDETKEKNKDWRLSSKVVYVEPGTAENLQDEFESEVVVDKENMKKDGNRKLYMEDLRDADDYKMDYQLKKIAITHENWFKKKDELVEKPGELSSEKDSSSVKKDTTIDDLVYGRADSKSKNLQLKKEKTDSEEDYDDDEYEDYGDYEEETTLKSKRAEEAGKRLTGSIPSSTYSPEFSNMPRRFPPLYLPSSVSSFGGSERSEETVENDEMENQTSIGIPYRYMPFPVTDPLGYAMTYPWLSIKDIVDKVEDAFVVLNRKDVDPKDKDSGSPEEELKSEVVDIEGKKYVLKTRSVQIGEEGDTRAYVSLVSVTPYTEEKSTEETTIPEEKIVPALVNKRKEEDTEEKEIKKKDSESRKRLNAEEEKKVKNTSDSESD